MRFVRRLSRGPKAEVELRTVETAGALNGVLAPKGWSDARVEAWLDWAEAQPADMPDAYPKTLAEDPAGDPVLAVDEFYAQGYQLVTSKEAQAAFDINS